MIASLVIISLIAFLVVIADFIMLNSLTKKYNILISNTKELKQDLLLIISKLENVN